MAPLRGLVATTAAVLDVTQTASKDFTTARRGRIAMAKRTAQSDQESDPDAAQNSGVINPYALAEVVIGRPINWRTVEDRPRMLEDILQTPYEELFDPQFGGPLYAGLRLNDRMELVRERSPLLDAKVEVAANDLEAMPPADLSTIRTLGDVGERFRVPDLAEMEVVRAEMLRSGHLSLTVRIPDAERLKRLSRVFTTRVMRTVAYDPTGAAVEDWTPPNGMWSDPGDFFRETAEFFDPIQGAVANCYYIAALGAVAWAMPTHIRHVTRALGQNQEQFTDAIRFYHGNGQLDKEIEVTEALPLSGSGNYLYCRSSEPGEIWPAVYEKAYAKLKTGIAGDHPDILATAWGDCVGATSQLVGRPAHYYGTGSHSADALWDLVRANSLGGRTFNPMTAWTHSSGTATEKKIVYADANIVASHCYTVLGWDYRDGLKYIILRNPWGNTEATVGTLNATTWLYDISWWRPINLTVVDGTFAIEASAFRQYFAGHGVAK